MAVMEYISKEYSKYWGGSSLSSMEASLAVLLLRIAVEVGALPGCPRSGTAASAPEAWRSLGVF